MSAARSAILIAPSYAVSATNLPSLVISREWLPLIERYGRRPFRYSVFHLAEPAASAAPAAMKGSARMTLDITVRV